MLFKSKTLDELIADFRKQNENRRGKIKDRIAKYETEIKRLREQIAEHSRGLVAAELADDAADTGKLEASIRKANTRLLELDNLIGVYRAELDRVEPEPGLFEKIRQAAKKERDARMEKLRACADEREALKQQIKELEQQIKLKEQEERNLSADREVMTLLPLLDNISPRASKLLPTEYDRKRWLRHWISDDTQIAEDFLARHEAARAAMVAADPHQARVINIEPRLQLGPPDMPEDAVCLKRTHITLSEAK